MFKCHLSIVSFNKLWAGAKSILCLFAIFVFVIREAAAFLAVHITQHRKTGKENLMALGTALLHLLLQIKHIVEKSLKPENQRMQEKKY